MLEQSVLHWQQVSSESYWLITNVDLFIMVMWMVWAPLGFYLFGRWRARNSNEGE